LQHYKKHNFIFIINTVVEKQANIKQNKITHNYYTPTKHQRQTIDKFIYAFIYLIIRKLLVLLCWRFVLFMLKKNALVELCAVF